MMDLLVTLLDFTMEKWSHVFFVPRVRRKKGQLGGLSSEMLDSAVLLAS